MRFVRMARPPSAGGSPPLLNPEVAAGHADRIGHSPRASAATADTSVAALISDLFLDYGEKLYRYCYSRLGTHEAAEDATSQAFVNALASLPRFRGTHHARWLFAIAHNVTVDYLRTPRPGQLPSDVIAYEDPDPGPETVALLQEEQLAIRQMLNSLSQQQSMAVQLYMAGFSLSETAEILRKSEGAVKMLRRRGLSKLREMAKTRGPSRGGANNVSTS